MIMNIDNKISLLAQNPSINYRNVANSRAINTKLQTMLIYLVPLWTT